ncbi:hypothetical protein [Myceligenerans crystallogenes]|uniref:MinD-like ATPase involved in chromosome partitioning or flagellar assembly n=1 Tax=Myceligenerans crystallogenes TaxID=316335 RepID=A0ABN2NL82_9MICO
MAVFALTGVNGGPGVSTTCLGLAMSWPRPVLLLEADPRGLSSLLTGWFQGSRPYRSGLVELALSSLSPADALRDVAQTIEGTHVSYVAGPRSHAQAPVLRGVWSPLADALAELETTGTDVIVDAGTLGAPGSPEPILARADATLVTVRSSLPALAGARPWADAVTREHPWQWPGLLVIGDGRPYTAREAGQALGLPVIAQIAWDPDGANVYYQGARPPRRFETSTYVRSLRAAVSALTSMAARARVDATTAVSAS